MKKIRRLSCIILAILLILPAKVHAKNKWPKMPHVEAPAICAMEISTGTIIYERNMDEQNFPASITKIMTALLAIENSAMDETVVFSEDAVYKNEGDTSHISRDIGEEMTMEECLYATMLESANECAWAIGEHVAGDMDSFTEMMNARAKELGCTNTHFHNPNGLPDEEHWTSAHDMALIAAEAYKNETFRVIIGATSYTIPPTNKHDEETPLHNHHKMVYPYQGDYEYLYDYAVGGKTGYTNAAGNTLVTFAQMGDMPIVVVVMRENTPYHYTDTRAVFDDCFENYRLLRVSDYVTEEDEASDMPSFASIDESANVLVPKGVSFSDLETRIIYDEDDDGALGTIEYSYAGRVVGRAAVRMNDVESEGFHFSEIISAGDEPSLEENAQTLQAGPGGSGISGPEGGRRIEIEINPKNIAIAAGVAVMALLLVLLLVWACRHLYLVRQNIVRMKSRRNERNRYRTIQDTRKGRKRGRRVKKSKTLRF